MVKKRRSNKRSKSSSESSSPQHSHYIAIVAVVAVVAVVILVMNSMGTLKSSDDAIAGEAFKFGKDKYAKPSSKLIKEPVGSKKGLGYQQKARKEWGGFLEGE